LVLVNDSVAQHPFPDLRFRQTNHRFGESSLFFFFLRCPALLSYNGEVNSSRPLLPRCAAFISHAQFFSLLLLVWLSLPERSWAGTTSLLLRGEPGDFIVGDETLYYG